MVLEPVYQLTVIKLKHVAAKTLELDAIGVVNVSIDQGISFSLYVENPTLGGFILIDKLTKDTSDASFGAIC